MKEGLELVIGAAVYLFWRLVASAWWILKVVVFISVVWGFVKALSDTAMPILGTAISAVKSADPKFVGADLVLWISDNWMSVAVAIIFINSVLGLKVQRELEKTSRYTRIFIGTIVSYFNIQPEISFSVRVREIGFWAAWKERSSSELVLTILGFPGDDTMTAKAKRNGREAHLVDDVKGSMSD